jgi:putative redox protein
MEYATPAGPVKAFKVGAGRWGYRFKHPIQQGVEDGTADPPRGEGKQVSTQIRGHNILTDQPLEAGGQNQAPAPYDLFLASIGTCAGYYIQAYCQSKEIDPAGIRLTLALKRDPETRAVTGFLTTIFVPPTLPEKLHPVLERVAAQCAVKKTIMAHPDFEMRTVVEG